MWTPDYADGVRVEILGPEGEDRGTLECAAGERLLDAFDEARARVAFGCRSATCGICLVEVLEGEAFLAPPDPVERIALEEMGASPRERLSCRASLVEGACGVLRLRTRSQPGS